MIPAALVQALAAMDRRLDPYSGAPLAVALSGGSDSLALLHLAHAWTTRVGRPLLVLTVDHGLNPESEGWTSQAGVMARGLGAGWAALRWPGPKPSTGLPAAARAARHALLATAAREAGASVVLLGHTADDVAESELIRRETPTHGRMAEWSPSPAWPEGRGVFLLRPLLSIRREALRSWLQVQGIAWLEDPANADPRFARVRARTRLDGSVHAPPVEPWPDEGDIEWVSVDAGGGTTLSVEGLLARRSPSDALARAVLCTSGRRSPPSRAALARVLAQLGSAGPLACTLGETRLRSLNGRLRITREPGRHPPPPLDLPVGAGVVFDGRFELTASAPGLRAWPLAGRAGTLSRADRKALRGITADVRPMLPVLLAEDGSPRLPAPYGGGPALARPLAAPRLAAALGWVTHEQAPRSGFPQANPLHSPHPELVEGRGVPSRVQRPRPSTSSG